MERTKSTHLKNLLDRALSEKATLNAYLLIVERKGKKREKEKAQKPEICNSHQESEAIRLIYGSR